MNNGEIECNGSFRNLLAEGGELGEYKQKSLPPLLPLLGYLPSWDSQVRPRLLDLSIQSPILMQFLSNIPKTKT